jgi:hypothetical protein
LYTVTVGSTEKTRFPLFWSMFLTFPIRIGFLVAVIEGNNF